MPFSQIIPPSPSPSESKTLLYTSVSLLLSRIQGHHYHLSKFRVYVFVYCIGVFLELFLKSQEGKSKKLGSSKKTYKDCLSKISCVRQWPSFLSSPKRRKTGRIDRSPANCFAFYGKKKRHPRPTPQTTNLWIICAWLWNSSVTVSPILGLLISFRLFLRLFWNLPKHMS